MYIYKVEQKQNKRDLAFLLSAVIFQLFILIIDLAKAFDLVVRLITAAKINIK